MEQLTKNQAVATSQEAVQNQNEPQVREEKAHNDKSVHGVLNPTDLPPLIPGSRRNGLSAARADARAGQPLQVNGYAHAGIAALKEVQVGVHRGEDDGPADDPCHAKAPGDDVEMLPPPATGRAGSGGDLPKGKTPAGTLGFDD